MDRIIRGLIAGTIGGVIMNIWDFISYYILKLQNHLYLDWASTLIYGHKPTNLLEYIFSLISQISWSGFLGIFFVFLIPFENSRRYLIICAFFGFIISFMLYAIPQLFKVPVLISVSTTTPVSHSIGATIWGLVLAQTLLRLKLTSKGKPR